MSKNIDISNSPTNCDCIRDKDPLVEQMKLSVVPPALRSVIPCAGKFYSKQTGTYYDSFYSERQKYILDDRIPSLTAKRAIISVIHNGARGWYNAEFLRRIQYILPKIAQMDGALIMGNRFNSRNKDATYYIANSQIKGCKCTGRSVVLPQTGEISFSQNGTVISNDAFDPFQARISNELQIHIAHGNEVHSDRIRVKIPDDAIIRKGYNGIYTVNKVVICE